MPHSILITQCLQNDFVKPLGRYDALPNMLHVGFDEARRLMGINPDEGAAMGGGFSSTFQKLYCAGLSRGKTEYYLAMVFREQLGRFYSAATLERVNLYVHGDLNGANIIIDSHDNVWLIDFFHTHRGHILKDLIKLENDLLYIFTPVNNADDLAQALHLTDCLLQVENLGQSLPDVETTGLTNSEMRRTYETIFFMRSFYPLLLQNDRNPLQLLIGQLRYAAHTLSFDESNDWQKQWALGAFIKSGKIFTK